MIESGRQHAVPAKSRRPPRTRAKILLVSATCALTITLTIALGGPAFALNPQPLPPMKVHVTIPAVQKTSVQCANGKHFGK